MASPEDWRYVELTRDELRLCGDIGNCRHIDHHYLEVRFDERGKDWHEPESVAAEMALHKWAGWYWEPSRWEPDSEAGDAGAHDCEVRYTQHTLKLDTRVGYLNVYPNEPNIYPNRRFVLVTGRNGGYHIVGWIRGFEARDIPLSERGGIRARWVPWRNLRTPDSLLADTIEP
jgi:hypothetical protein